MENFKLKLFLTVVGLAALTAPCIADQDSTVDFGKHATWKVPIVYMKEGTLVVRAICHESSNCRIRIKVYKKDSLKADGWGTVKFNCDGRTSKDNMWYLILTSPNCKHECYVIVQSATGTVKLTNHAENKGTAILILIDDDDQGYKVEAKPGETVTYEVEIGTYRWFIECPKGTVVGGEIRLPGKRVIVSKATITEGRVRHWTLPKLPSRKK